ncbi:hypothetical protein HanRHA438_Chr06g0264571 [Helianthus annuus]|nr:hypothetical protein HanHA300_Chr06g0209491 [Helianthus annuus]KAJ0573274.1 hypothetical protein HanHA89_Chr06g0224941 [Helianthus annuus]KAJ0573275.1 hypothetical protein HanHA89_Chr06g0224951 [Helianthus annuus]KAJ0911567.1 hypothetical protein HanRHA438_Chr06g0264571 [Helianthus annuus]KAJ0915133.1 hypothetical protein HanPSC8_Chr06g0246451 [Helianthus annuus]
MEGLIPSLVAKHRPTCCPSFHSYKIMKPASPSNFTIAEYSELILVYASPIIVPNHEPGCSGLDTISLYLHYGDNYLTGDLRTSTESPPPFVSRGFSSENMKPLKTFSSENNSLRVGCQSPCNFAGWSEKTIGILRPSSLVRYFFFLLSIHFTSILTSSNAMNCVEQIMKSVSCSLRNRL